MTNEEETITRELYSLEDKYRNILSDRVEIKKDEYGYNENDILIFPLWYFSESKTTRISFLKTAIGKKKFIQELDEAIDFENSFRESRKNKRASKKLNSDE